MDFKEYIETQDKFTALFLLAEQIDELDGADESTLNESTQSIMGKLGLHAHKSKSILSYVKSFASGAGKVILYLIK